jgi:hypothetical protein
MLTCCIRNDTKYWYSIDIGTVPSLYLLLVAYWKVTFTFTIEAMVMLWQWLRDSMTRMNLSRPSEDPTILRAVAIVTLISLVVGSVCVYVYSYYYYSGSNSGVTSKDSQSTATSTTPRTATSTTIPTNNATNRQQSRLLRYQFGILEETDLTLYEEEDKEACKEVVVEEEEEDGKIPLKATATECSGRDKGRCYGGRYNH